MKKKIFISYSNNDFHKMHHFERIIKSQNGLEPIIIADNKKALIQLTEEVKNGII